MTIKVTTFNEATIDAKIFAAYSKKALEELAAEDAAKTAAKESSKDFKETVEAISLTTKLPKAEVSAYFKARYEERKPQDEDKPVGTAVAINRGELYTVLNSVLAN